MTGGNLVLDAVGKEYRTAGAPVTDVMLLAIVLVAGLGKLSDWALGAVEHRLVGRRS